MAQIEASECVITISSIPKRKASEYFTELEGDRSDLRQDLPDLEASNLRSANSLGKWRARQDSNLRPSA